MKHTIPKAIRYIWFGGGRHTELQKRCMASWHKHAPDFEIIRWDESNCSINENKYVSQAYEAGKWAFVSDYFRFKILYEYGGVYMDTDIELHKPLAGITNADAFFAFEKQDLVNAGITGAIPKHPIIAEILKSYKNEVFVFKNGRLNLSPVPIRTTKVLRRHGLRLNGRHQVLAHNTEIFPANILTLDAGDGELTAEHHYEASWSDRKKAKSYKEYLLREYTKNGTCASFRRMLKRGATEIKFFMTANSPL